MADATPGTIHALMGGLVDYAGLFPPAKLGMPQAVANYAKYLRSPEAWMLGRFIVPVSRIEEFRKSAIEHLPTKAPARGSDADAERNPATEPWPISALIDGDLDENLDSIFAFNHEHEQPKNGLALIDAIEIKVPQEGDAGVTGPFGAAYIDSTLDLIPEELYPFFEIPVLPAKGSTTAPDFRGMVAALAGCDAAAKIRTGSITADGFPASEVIAEFLVACQNAEVPFKATAGLHHACRAHYALTYEPDSAKAVMHGFLNVFLAAALVSTHRIPTEKAAQVLSETDPAAFRFGDQIASWREFGLETTQLAHARETFALSFGSCSFDEPVEELRHLRLI